MEEKDELDSLFLNAFEDFKIKSKQNIQNNTSERNWCGILYYCLIQEIQKHKTYHSYFIDIEYNRNHGELKNVINESNGIIMDIIIHKRGEVPDDNLIAIEMKKSSRSESAKRADRTRLRKITKSYSPDNTEHQKYFSKETNYPKFIFGYKRGFYIEINNTSKDNKIYFKIIAFKEGKLLNTISDSIDRDNLEVGYAQAMQYPSPDNGE
jgi:hypothetical protein